MKLFRISLVWIALFLIVSVCYVLDGGHLRSLAQPFQWAMMAGIYLLAYWPTNVLNSDLQTRQRLNLVCAFCYMALCSSLNLIHAYAFFDQGWETFGLHLVTAFVAIPIAFIGYFSMEISFHLEDRRSQKNLRGIAGLREKNSPLKKAADG
jgi:hypothetical protein